MIATPYLAGGFNRLQRTEFDDARWNQVTALLPFDGPNASTVMRDIKGGTYTRFGNAQISTAQSQFGGSSLLLDGSGDYITRAYSTTLFDWYTSDYTMEAWIRPAANTSFPAVIGNTNPTANNNFWGFGIEGSGLVIFYYFSSAAYFVQGTTSLSLNNWHHIAMTYISATQTINVFADGVLEASIARVGTPTSNVSAPLSIGQTNNVSFNGYIDDLRITKGFARYTATFTPPARAFPLS